MQKRNVLFWSTLFIIILASCTDCEKLKLTQDERTWIDHYSLGQTVLFQNSKGQQDTLEVGEIRDFFTPCNKIELSSYQFEVFDVSFKLRSLGKLHDLTGLLVFQTSSYEPRIPNIFLGNLGPRMNALKRKMPEAIDTIINSVKLISVLYYSDNSDNDNYADRKTLKSFFWNKTLGLMAYTTVNNVSFVKIF